AAGGGQSGCNRVPGDSGWGRRGWRGSGDGAPDNGLKAVAGKVRTVVGSGEPVRIAAPGDTRPDSRANRRGSAAIGGGPYAARRLKRHNRWHGCQPVIRSSSGDLRGSDCTS